MPEYGQAICECGCGTPVLKYDKRGYRRRFVRGHKTGRPNPVIECACGCGNTLTARDNRGRHRQHLPGHGLPGSELTGQTVACEWCGVLSYKPGWHLRKVEHYYCSRECSNKSKEHPDGRKREYRETWTDNLKQAIRERDGYHCRDCGAVASNRALDVHHIDFGKTDDSPANLISLCRTCHKARHDEATSPHY